MFVSVKRTQGRSAAASRPAGGGEIGDLAQGSLIQARQHGGEVFFHRHAQSRARFDDRKNRGHFRALLGTAHMQPVLAAQGDGAHGVSVRLLDNSTWA